MTAHFNGMAVAVQMVRHPRLVMKAAIAIVICALILLLATAVHRTIADHENRKDIAAIELDQDHKTDSTRSEWSADPSRGWIRLNDRANKESDALQSNSKSGEY